MVADGGRRVIAPRTLLLLALAAALPACVGVSWCGTATYDSARPEEHVIRPPRRSPKLRRADDLVRSFGEPDERRATADGAEEWVYLDGWRWNGPVLFVVIPLPLLVPVGHDSTTYVLRDGVVERDIRVEQTWSGAYCAPFGHEPGCHSFDE